MAVAIVLAFAFGYALTLGPLLRGGVELHEVKAQERPESAGKFGSSGASLHTKAFVLDGRRGFVGSFNLDPRSADLNTEMGVLFDDPGIAADVRREYLRLAGPALSYRVLLDERDGLRWIDDSATPPRVLVDEPDTDARERLQARFFQALPIESQL
jgi:putative cardiolipin synthase